MIWLFKKIFGLSVAVAILYFVLQFPIGGRPLKQYVVDFYRSPLVQEVIRQSKMATTRYLQKDILPGNSPKEEGEPPLERVEEEERQELEKVLKESR